MIRIALLTTVAGSIFQVIGYAIDSPAPPFPVFVLAFALNGFGVALQVGRVFCPGYCVAEFSTRTLVHVDMSQA